MRVFAAADHERVVLVECKSCAQFAAGYNIKVTRMEIGKLDVEIDGLTAVVNYLSLSYSVKQYKQYHPTKVKPSEDDAAIQGFFRRISSGQTCFERSLLPPGSRGRTKKHARIATPPTVN